MEKLWENEDASIVASIENEGRKWQKYDFFFFKFY